MAVTQQQMNLAGFAAALVVASMTLVASAEPQTRSSGPSAPGKAEKALREHDLETVRAEQKRAAEAEAKLKAEIAVLGENRRALSQVLIDTASRMRLTEARLIESEGRLKTLDDHERTIRSSLEDRRAVIAEVLAALQRIGRRPPPALMVRPEDALQSVRTAILLGAVLPEMRIEAEALAADLAELVKVRNEAVAERESASLDLAALSEDRRRMSLLIDERQKKQAETEQALQAESDRMTALARQADTLKDLIAKIEQDLAATAAREAEAGRVIAPKEPAPTARQTLALLKDPGRLAPAIAFASAKGVLPMPVSGNPIRHFGDSDGLGGADKGVSITARPGAQVTAPCDGWVVYAGPFRSYGQLLILNAGGGYHVLLAGMERISVDLGQFVLTGEPVAVMGGGPQAAALIASGASRPVLYVEFRKDGAPVDPSPWWTTKVSEKGRG